MEDSGKALVLLSGGQDSTTVLGVAIRAHGVDNVRTLTFDYGPRAERVVFTAGRVAGQLGVASYNQEFLELQDGLLGSPSPLLSGRSWAPDSALVEGVPPSTFVEGRNILFLAIAANRAAVNRISVIYMGVRQVDSTGYPDHREGFITRMEQAIRMGLGRENMVVSAPLMYFDKKQVVETAVHLQRIGLPMMEALSESRTCYVGDEVPCGDCGACTARASGFVRAGIADPLLERLRSSARAERIT